MSDVALELAIGALAGFAGGLLGIGGGALFVPALVVFAGLGQVEAEATSLLAIVPVALVGTWLQHRYGNVELRPALAMGVLAAGGVGAGVILANTVPARGLQVAFAILLLVVAAQLVRDALRPERPPGPGPSPVRGPGA